MTVFPQPKAPGMAVVPPCTHLQTEKKLISGQPFYNSLLITGLRKDVRLTGKGRPALSVRSAAGDWQAASL